MPALCIRGSVLRVCNSLRGSLLCQHSMCLCTCASCWANYVFFVVCIWQSWAIPLELWETQRVVGSLDVRWCLWPTDPVIQKHQLDSVSVGLSDITLPSELLPVASDHCKGRRWGTDFIPEIDPLCSRREGRASYKSGTPFLICTVYTVFTLWMPSF